MAETWMSGDIHTYVDQRRHKITELILLYSSQHKLYKAKFAAPTYFLMRLASLPTLISLKILSSRYSPLA